MITFLPVDSKARKDLPVATGVVDYFPLALVAIAELSRIGNDKHNPGEPLHWARGKGGNNADELMRHFIERGTADVDDGVLHSTKVAWRALALLQLELEAATAKGKPAPEKPSRAEVIAAFNPKNTDPCGFARHNGGDLTMVYMCRCGANVRPGEARPDACDARKEDAAAKPDTVGAAIARFIVAQKPPKSGRSVGMHPALGAPYGGEPVCGFDHGKRFPGVNVGCAKCFGTIGDELRPAKCKHWITE